MLYASLVDEMSGGLVSRAEARRVVDEALDDITAPTAAAAGALVVEKDLRTQEAEQAAMVSLAGGPAERIPGG